MTEEFPDHYLLFSHTTDEILFTIEVEEQEDNPEIQEVIYGRCFKLGITDRPNIFGAGIHDLIIKNTTFSNKKFTNCIFRSCNFEKVIFKNCVFDESSFLDCIFNHCEFEDCEFTTSTIVKTRVSGSSFKTTKFAHIKFICCNLNFNKFIKIEFFRCNFKLGNSIYDNEFITTKAHTSSDLGLMVFVKDDNNGLLESCYERKKL